jgi:hypothetical protein
MPPNSAIVFIDSYIGQARLLNITIRDLHSSQRRRRANHTGQTHAVELLVAWVFGARAAPAFLQRVSSTQIAKKACTFFLT